MEQTGEIEALVRYQDLSMETFRGTNPREIADKINGQSVREARVRLLTARQCNGFGYADIHDADKWETVFGCALRRALRNRAARVAPVESRR
jgi:hypothetical protein